MLLSSDATTSLSSLAVWGILMQTIGFAVLFPLYLCLHLFTSPLVVTNSTKGAPPSLANMMLIPIGDLQALPISVTLGYTLPIVLMSLPSPAIISFDTHQLFMSLWQIYPIPVALLQMSLAPLLTAIFPPRSKYHSAADRNSHLLLYLRGTYIFAFAFASITHVATLTLSVSSLLIPSIFQPTIVPFLHPQLVFLPPAPYTSTPVATMGDGLLNFFLYDEYIGFLATIIWAVTVNHNAHKGTDTWAELLSLWGKIAGLTLVTGPASAVVWLLWERDEQVLGAGVFQGDKKTI